MTEPPSEAPSPDPAIAARDAILTYAADLFWRFGWRVRVTADWIEDGALRLRVEPTNIQNYSATIEISPSQLLNKEDREFVDQEIEGMPKRMVAFVFGSEACAMINVSPERR